MLKKISINGFAIIFLCSLLQSCSTTPTGDDVGFNDISIKFILTGKIGNSPSSVLSDEIEIGEILMPIQKRGCLSKSLQCFIDTVSFIRVDTLPILPISIEVNKGWKIPEINLFGAPSYAKIEENSEEYLAKTEIGEKLSSDYPIMTDSIKIQLLSSYLQTVKDGAGTIIILSKEKISGLPLSFPKCQIFNSSDSVRDFISNRYCENQPKNFYIIYNPPKIETAEEIAKREAEEIAKKEAEDKAKAAAAQLKKEAEEKAKADAERIKKETEEKAKAEAERLKKEADDKVKAEAERINREERMKAAEEAKKAREARAKEEAEFLKAHPFAALKISYEMGTSLNWNNVGAGYKYQITIKEQDTGNIKYVSQNPQSATSLNLPINGLTNGVLYKILIQSKYDSRNGSKQECPFSLVDGGRKLNPKCTPCN